MGLLSDLRVKIFADGADLAAIADVSGNPLIKGFTTNPTLMRKSGVEDYRAFAVELLRMVPDRPVSLEVFSDEFAEMERQARVIAAWGPNVYVKIPVTNTRGDFAGPLITRLSAAGVRVNVTALMTPCQVTRVAECLSPATPSFVSVFAGRIADSGRDPVPLMLEALQILQPHPAVELIWASPRELLNIVQADVIGCHIITVSNDLLAKLPLLGKDLEAFSLDTVRMFYEDAKKAGYSIDTSRVLAIPVAEAETI
jgi:transaldolase